MGKIARESTDYRTKDKKAYMQAISDKNLERLRQRVTGFWDYKLDL